MPIPDDEKKRYSDFALQLTRDLKSIAIPPDKILWHYTNGNALISILDSMTIYSTQISCLNDSSELRYGATLFREGLLSTRSTYVDDEFAIKIVDSGLEYFKENPDFPAQASTPHFVTCFSEEEDDLSQWRAYGGGENGYAIGFKTGDLWGRPNTIVARISYDGALHRTLAKGAADAMVRFCLDGLRKSRSVDVLKFGEEFLGEWEKAITMVAPLIKAPGFSKECECRIVTGLTANDLQHLRFTQKANMMARHLPLRPPLQTPVDPYRLPVAKIMVGPCRHPQISRNSVDTLLRQKGYPAGLVSISKIPFQIA